MAAGEPLRIGNSSGFYGDRFEAVAEMLDGGPLDVLTGDYLAELTMLILGRDRLKDPRQGYARTFLRQLEGTLGRAVERGVRLITNAGGLNPAGLAEQIAALADRLGLTVRIGYVTGDDLLERAEELGFGQPLTANAYLGGWGIADCLRAGADVVVTGRVTDASLVLGPAAAHFGWGRQDWDALAGAVVAGHVLECGTQATGGNYSFFAELQAAGYDLTRPGFPIAEISADGSSVITKHAGTAGALNLETVTAQLLYEIGGARYAGPDVTARFDRIQLSDDGPDRVRISGVRGEPPPPTSKVSINRLAGYANEVQFVLTGLDIEAKAALVRRQLADVLPADATWTLSRTDQADAGSEAAASAMLRCVVHSPDPVSIGRRFSAAAVELALGSYPGFHLSAPPGEAKPVAVFEAGYLAAKAVPHVAVLPDGRRVEVPATATVADLVEVAEPAVPPWQPGPTRRLPLGSVLGARSGDKGGSANLGIWARTPPAWPWLVHTLTAEKLQELLPELAALPIERHLLPNLLGLNFVIDGLLGRGVADNVRFDPQAKALGEWFRSRLADIPEKLLA
jgi:hypothetical protein